MAAFQAITEAIARLADEERDASRFFTNTGRMIGPIQRVNVDLASGMLEELARAATKRVYLWCFVVVLTSGIALRVEAALYARRIVSVVRMLSTLRIGETSKAETLSRMPSLRPRDLTAHLAAMRTSVSPLEWKMACQAVCCGEPVTIFFRMSCVGGFSCRESRHLRQLHIRKSLVF